MVDTDDSGDPDHAERLAAHHRTIKDGWQEALKDMEAMAEQREDRGFETLTIPTGDTAPEPPNVGDEDRWGLVHVIPDNYADRFTELYEVSQFDDTGVYQAMVDGQVFVVTELVDTPGGNIVFLAGHYEMRHAPALVRTAMDRNVMFTHVQTLDNTQLGTVKHDDPSDFFPDPDRFLAYEQDL